MSESSTVVSSIYRSGKRYDSFFPISAEAINYWSTLAQQYGDPILEVMCGTGAISVPLAQQGYRVTGLDLAETMLDEARRKSIAAGVDVRWVNGDVRDFDLGEQYKLIFLPTNSICHLYTREDMEACLQCVARHLHPEGRFAVNVFVPSLALLTKSPEEEYEFLACIDPESGDEIVMTQCSSYDTATQITQNKLYTRINGGPAQPDGELNMRMFFPQELDALFWYNGFAIEHKYGGSYGQPFDAQSTTQMYILKRR